LKMVTVSGNELRWGILGCGNISGDFTQAVMLHGREANVIKAVAASSSLDRAEEFLQHYQLNKYFGPDVKAYGSYSELLADPRIHVVYVGLLNHQHKEAVLQALRAGKHVLCEKPMGVNAKEVRETVSEAKQRGLFLMEAYWSRFFPAWQAVGESLGQIGGAQCVVADFGCSIHAVNKTQLDWGGGYLLATGCYLHMLASYVFRTADGHPQRPTRIHAVGQLLEEQGTDAWANVTLEYEGGKKQAERSALLHRPGHHSLRGIHQRPQRGATHPLGLLEPGEGVEEGDCGRGGEEGGARLPHATESIWWGDALELEVQSSEVAGAELRDRPRLPMHSGRPARQRHHARGGVHHTGRD